MLVAGPSSPGRKSHDLCYVCMLVMTDDSNPLKIVAAARLAPKQPPVWPWRVGWSLSILVSPDAAASDSFCIVAAAARGTMFDSKSLRYVLQHARQASSSPQYTVPQCCCHRPVDACALPRRIMHHHHEMSMASVRIVLSCLPAALPPVPLPRVLQEVQWPSRVAQQTIAATLSTYDTEDDDVPTGRNIDERTTTTSIHSDGSGAVPPERTSIRLTGSVLTQALPSTQSWWTS